MKRKLSLLLSLLLTISLVFPGAAQALAARRPSGRPAGAAVVLPDLSNLKQLPRTTNRGRVPPDKRGQRLVVSRHGSALGCITPQLSADLTESPLAAPAAPGLASALRLQSANADDPDIGDTKDFYLDVDSDYNRPKKTGELIAIGEHCYIYVIQDAAVFENNRDLACENAAYIAETFDEQIYPMMTDEERETYFGQPRDVDGNGKLTILYYDISPASTGGYFWGGDFAAPGGSGDYRNSNYADIVYLQSVYLTTGLTVGLGTLTHEFQHVINYSEYAAHYATRAMADDWLDEGLSELAREFYEGGLDTSRIPYTWVSSQIVGPGLTPGSGYINWNGTLGNYAAASLLLHQYYYQQSGHDPIRALVTDGRAANQYVNSYVEHYKDTALPDFKSLFRQHALLMTVDSYYETESGVYDYDFRGLDVWGTMATNASAWPTTTGLGSIVRLPLQISSGYYSNGPYRYHVRLFQAPADVSHVSITIGSPGSGEYFVVTPYNAANIDTQQEFIAVNKMAAQLGTESATTVTVGSGNLFAVVGVAYASAISATARATETTPPAEPTLQSIAITAPANKLIYTVGDALDLTGLAVTGTYSNGTTKAETITTANVTGFDSSAATASQTLTITVSGKTATYTIEIVEPTLQSIAITASANKLIYTVGDVLDLTGLVVTGTYSNGTTKAEAITTANVTGFNSSASTASQTLTITVSGKTTTYTIQIVEPTLQSIAITAPANKLIYTVGDALDLTGLVVMGTYSNGTTKAEAITTANVTGFNSSASTASQTLTITVSGKTATYVIQIVEPTLQSIAITAPANKLIYTVGDALDLTGLVVTGTYSNGTTKAETITTANVTGFNSSAAAASQTLTITVSGKTATYVIQIVEPTLQSIAITAPANRLIYTVGDALDLTGLVVTGTYSNGTTKAEAITTANVTGFNSSAATASQTLTITVSGKTATYTIQIVEPTLQSIAITAPANKLIYTVGDALDLTGLAVTGTYSNGTTKAETITTANVTGFDSHAATASQTLTITVSGKTTTYTIEVVDEPAPPPGQGRFTVTADKAAKMVRIEGAGYAPGQTLTLWMAYDREPTRQDNDYAAQVTANGQGLVDFVLPEEAVRDQPWLGGHVFQVALDGDVQSSEMLLATQVRAHSSARVSLRIKGKAILHFAIDGVLYEFVSSNPTIVKVDQKGVLTGVRGGTTIVTLRATDGSDLMHLVVISVS
ncbi:MAG: bacterial Ig-like domain-containing protein [Oscillospiraceae bacterium]|jgi:hypothetical protein|nr:bacterial Ig-like domain-containing protein [Oscillospiraceae bacterium]